MLAHIGGKHWIIYHFFQTLNYTSGYISMAKCNITKWGRMNFYDGGRKRKKKKQFYIPKLEKKRYIGRQRVICIWSCSILFHLIFFQFKYNYNLVLFSSIWFYYISPFPSFHSAFGLTGFFIIIFLEEN